MILLKNLNLFPKIKLSNMTVEGWGKRDGGEKWGMRGEKDKKMRRKEEPEKKSV